MSSLNVVPNLQLIYVSDLARSAKFYKMLFKAEPIVKTPRYVPFKVDGKAVFALWTGGGEVDQEAPRFSEIGIMLKSDEEVERLYAEWKKNDEIKFEKEIYSERFGRTFLVRDPDGHIIRVCPLDP